MLNDYDYEYLFMPSCSKHMISEEELSKNTFSSLTSSKQTNEHQNHCFGWIFVERLVLEK